MFSFSGFGFWGFWPNPKSNFFPPKLPIPTRYREAAEAYLDLTIGKAAARTWEMGFGVEGSVRFGI